MSEPISQFVGNDLYLDAMIFHMLLRGQNPISESLFQRIESGDIQAHTSVLTFDELAYRMLPALIKDRLVSHDSDFDTVPFIQRYTLD